MRLRVTLGMVAITTAFAAVLMTPLAGAANHPPITQTGDSSLITSISVDGGSYGGRGASEVRFTPSRLVDAVLNVTTQSGTEVISLTDKHVQGASITGWNGEKPDKTIAGPGTYSLAFVVTDVANPTDVYTARWQITVTAATGVKSGLQWKWYVIEQDRFVTTLTPPIDVTFVTGDVLEWPGESTNLIGTMAKFENRLRLTVTGMAIGSKLALRAARTCSNASDLSATTTSSTTKVYALAIKAGQKTLLPAAVQALHVGVSCAWAFRLSIPHSKRATVTVEALGYRVPGYEPEVPSSTDWSDGGYDRQSCTITVSGRTTSHSCKPIRLP